MKKLLYAFILISLAFTSCDKSDDGDLDNLKKENQELREALAAHSKITNVEFTETEMILTYSNGLKLTTVIPDVLKGEPGDTPRIGDNGNWWIGDTDTGVIAQGQNGSDGSNGGDGNSPYIGDNGNWWTSESDTGIPAMGKDGADGANGVGIKSISYDPVTGMMTITLTNDQVTKFVVASNSEGDLSAKILEDLNGKYLMTKATMGDIPYAVVEYNDDNQIAKITSFTADGYQLLKSFEIEKEYTDGKVSKIIRRDFATEQIVKYNDEYAENRNGYEWVQLEEDKGYDFIEENSDGSYYYYSRRYEENGKYNYHRYYASKNSRLDNEVVSHGDGTYKVYNYYSSYQVYNSTTGEQDTYYYYSVYDDCFVFDKYDDSKRSIKLEDGVFKIYNHNFSEFNISRVPTQKHIYYHYLTRTITGVYEIGDPFNESYSSIEYNSSGNIDKIYKATVEGAEANSYAKNCYDANGNCIQIDQYILKDGKWLKDDFYITHEYTTQNFLSKTTEHLADGRENDVLKVIYDNESNPIEIFKYFSSVLRGWDYNNVVDPETGLWVGEEDILHEAGLYSYIKVDYNYNMKNFFGNTLGVVFPELYGFNFNNAIKSIAVSNTMRAGSIEYKDFNDGGYPQIMEYIISGDIEDDYSYTGQMKLEYKKVD